MPFPHSKILFPAVALLGILGAESCALAQDRPVAQPRQGGQPDKPAPASVFTGRIDRVDVDRRLLTLMDVTAVGGARESAGARTFIVSEFARIMLDGKDAQLRELHEGFTARVELRPGAPAGRPDERRDANGPGKESGGARRRTEPAAAPVVERIEAYSRGSPAARKDR